MDKFEYEVLEGVRKRFEELGGRAEYESDARGPGESARQFYLSKLEDNLVTPMDPRHAAEYGRGAGKELDDKMRALRSSSAMTFNLLGNGTCTFGPNDLGVAQGTYTIEYERQARTLKEGLGFPAHLDAWLESDPSDGTIVACEMKMMEWLTTDHHKLAEKYLDEDNYQENGFFFSNVAERLTNPKEHYIPLEFVRYDWPQMFKHSVALFNEMGKPEYIGWVHKVVLLNVVWEPEVLPEPEEAAKRYAVTRAREQTEFRTFKEVMRGIRGLFLKDRGMDFTIKYRSAGDFMDMLSYDDDEVVRKLGRYR